MPEQYLRIPPQFSIENQDQEKFFSKKESHLSFDFFYHDNHILKNNKIEVQFSKLQLLDICKRHTL